MEHFETYICITRLGQESFISEEAKRFPVPPQCTELAPGVVELSGISAKELQENPLFFACQLLPNPQKLAAQSIKSWATLVVEQLAEKLDPPPSEWGLHVFEQASAESGKQYSRARLIEQEILAVLKQKRRSLLKGLENKDAAPTTLVQLLLTSPEEGYLSISHPSDFEALNPILSPFLAGYVHIPDDRSPPSRAFKKLKEATTRFSLVFRRGMRCADLGACPGGWSHVLVGDGCRVWAVDRSPLAPTLMKSKQVAFVQADAFSWTPEQPLDWMVCDVIAAPERTCSLIERWLTQRLCKALCVTIKFKGAPDFAALSKIKKLLAGSCSRYSGRQLTNNKNELTIFGILNS